MQGGRFFEGTVGCPVPAAAPQYLLASVNPAPHLGGHLLRSPLLNIKGPDYGDVFRTPAVV